MSRRVVIIGGGHNGLVTAAYLARAGLEPLVLERRGVLGGACVTEEPWPGYKVSRAAYVAGLLRPAVIRELGLEARGLRLLQRDPASITPMADGRALILGRDERANHASIAQFSRRDADAYPAYEGFLDKVARNLEPLLDSPVPDPAGLFWRDLPTLGRLAAAGWRLRGDLSRAMNLLMGPARPTIETWFESEPLRATLATDAVIGAWAAPSTPGTGYVLFHHVMGETGGARGVWAYVQGGMGQVSETIADAAREAGAEIRPGSPVKQIEVEGGRARGVLLEDGTAIEASTVVSAADPYVTFRKLLDAKHLPEALVREVDHLDFRSPAMKINLVLDRPPRFRGISGDAIGPEHQGTIHLGACDLDSLEEAYAAAQRGALPELPMIELTIPSAVDSTLAPEGHLVASMFVQYVPYALEGTSWDAQRDAFADRVFAIIDQVAPGFSESVLHREVLAPPDIERIFGLTGGNLFHGAMTIDRLLFMRPFPGHSRYRTPIAGLYLCASGAHPGGGVMGACGRTAAAEILHDLKP